MVFWIGIYCKVGAIFLYKFYVVSVVTVLLEELFALHAVAINYFLWQFEVIDQHDRCYKVFELGVILNIQQLEQTFDVVGIGQF